MIHKFSLICLSLCRYLQYIACIPFYYKLYCMLHGLVTEGKFFWFSEIYPTLFWSSNHSDTHISTKYISLRQWCLCSTTLTDMISTSLTYCDLHIRTSDSSTLFTSNTVIRLSSYCIQLFKSYFELSGSGKKINIRYVYILNYVLVISSHDSLESWGHLLAVKLQSWFRCNSTTVNLRYTYSKVHL